MSINTVEVLNAVRLNASTAYVDRIPVATQANILAVGNAIIAYDVTKNEFLNALVNRIGKVTVSSRMANNKLAVFKKGMMEYGMDIEEIFTTMAKSQVYDETIAESEIFKRVKPDVKAIFHRKNREDFYKVTINDSQLKSAFLSSNGMSTLIGTIINSLYSGDNFDEYILMKNLLAQYEDNYYEVQTAVVSDETTGKTFARAIKQKVVDVGFMNSLHNKQGVKQISDPSQLVLLLHKDVSPIMETEVLAWAFNSSNFNYDTQVIIVDDFGVMANVQALLVDKEFFQVYDTKFEMTSQYNAEGLYWNYWLHHWQLLSTSQFHTAIKFTVATV